eukprot:9632758-Prorocentrum_lima.AAC.1
MATFRIQLFGLISAGSQRNDTADSPNALELRIHAGFRSRRGNRLRFGFTTGGKQQSGREMGQNTDSRIPLAISKITDT